MSAAATALKRKIGKVYDSPEELALVHRAKKGDELAFAQLYEHHINHIKFRINRIVNDEDHSAELANATFTKVWKQLSGFEEKSRFDTWITRIAINEALMHVRREKSLRRSTPVSLDALVDFQSENHNSIRPPSFSNQKYLAVRDLELAGIADRQVLETAIKRVPIKFRTALLLRFWHGHSIEEIRQILSTDKKEFTTPAVKTRLLRGRLILMEQVASLS